MAANRFLAYLQKVHAFVGGKGLVVWGCSLPLWKPTTPNAQQDPKTWFAAHLASDLLEEVYKLRELQRAVDAYIAQVDHTLIGVDENVDAEFARMRAALGDVPRGDEPALLFHGPDGQSALGALLAHLTKSSVAVVEAQADRDCRPFPVLWQGAEDHKYLRDNPHAPRSVPWSLLAPHEAQAKQNHDQTLERLAERGGLAVHEMLAIIEGKRWRAVASLSNEAAVEELLAHVARHAAARPSP